MKKIIVAFVLVFGLVGVASADGRGHGGGHHGNGWVPFLGGVVLGTMINDGYRPPVYYAPAPVYYPPTYYVQPQPVYVQPQPQVVYVERPQAERQQSGGCYNAPQKLYDEKGRSLGSRTVHVCPE